MQNIMLVFLGGGLGAVCRYCVTTQAGARFGSIFPWGTLTVNTLGSFLMGAVMGSIFFMTNRMGDGLAEPVRLLLTAGFLGGFTTFSSFSMETLTLLRGGSILYAIGNISANVLLGLASAGCGLLLAWQFTK